MYPAFREFYGMEEVIERGRRPTSGMPRKVLRRRSRFSTCSGPVGGGKSSHRRAPEAADGDACRSTR